MVKYVGVKIVEAEPCAAWKKSGAYGIGASGYKVVYPDGYVSWCPKVEFEKANRQCGGMSFGHALEAVNQGHKIKAPEWGGYWFKESGTIKVMTAEGEVLDTPYFQQYIFRTDWQIVE